MTLASSVKNNLKKLRSTQPFNRVTTSTLRYLMSVTGMKSEAIVKHLPRVGLVETVLPNQTVFRIKSKGDDWVSNQIFWNGWEAYEPETTPLFFRLAQKAEVVFDIGAYVGFYTVLAAHANPNSKVYAFEPLPAIYKRLEQNIAINNFTNVELVFGAVGSEAGEAQFFHVGEYEMPTSSSLSQEFMKVWDHLATTTVKVRRLDDLGIDKVDLIKVDTESTEPDVFLGGIELLKRSLPNIFCEVLKDQGTEEKLHDILGPLGYNYYHLTPDGPVRCEQIKGHSDHLNYLFSIAGEKEVANY